MAKIFLSHWSKDKEIADRIYKLLLNALKLKENDIFYTSRDGGPLMEGDLEDIIEEQIRECVSFVFLVSKGFLDSDNCKLEYTSAKALQKPRHVFLFDDLCYRDLDQTPLRSVTYRRLGDGKCLITILHMVNDELSLTPFDENDEKRIENAVGDYLKFDFSKNANLLPQNMPVATHGVVAAVDDYIHNLESNYRKSEEAAYLLGCALFDGVLVKNDMGRAVDLIRDSADKGYVPALLKLAYFYCRGVVNFGSLQFNEAFKCVEHAAKISPSDPRVCVAMGLMYYFGVGCPKNLKSSRYYFQLGNNLGDKISRGYLKFLDGIQQYRKSTLELIEQVASTDDPENLYRAGILYLNGGVDFDPDLDKAYDYMLRAASKGVAAAGEYLGEFYYFGWGNVTCDLDKAVEYFQMAADKGYKFSQCCLGFLNQYNILKDGLQKAILWYDMASLQGDSEANLALGILRGQYGFESGYHEAFDYLTFAAEGSSGAQCLLGDVYRFGLLGQKQNSHLAGRWYNIAIENGSCVAKLRIKNDIGILVPN